MKKKINMLFLIVILFSILTSFFVFADDLGLIPIPIDVSVPKNKTEADSMGWTMIKPSEGSYYEVIINGRSYYQKPINKKVKIEDVNISIGNDGKFQMDDPLNNSDEIQIIQNELTTPQKENVTNNIESFKNLINGLTNIFILLLTVLFLTKLLTYLVILNPENRVRAKEGMLIPFMLILGTIVMRYLFFNIVG